MKLTEAIANVRAAMDDTGLFLTFTNDTDAADQNQLHVAELAQVQPGTYILVGTGDTIEGHLVIAASARSGAGTVTLATPLVNASPANNPLSLAQTRDEDYTKDISKAVAEYSKYRPLLKRYPNGGLVVTAGTDTYALPTDFIAPDRDSFDKAVGIRSSVANSNGVYSLVFDASNQLSAVGYGSMTNFGPAAWGAGGFMPINGNPNDNPNGGLFPQQPLTFTFIKAAQPQLVITPAPTLGATYDFFYQAGHAAPTLAADTTVPDNDVHLVLAYAKYLRCNALAVSAAKITSQKAGGEEISFSKSPDEYRKSAKEALDEFERNTRFTPNGLAG